GLGTVFPASGKASVGRKNWIGFSVRHKGVLVVDAGARRAVVERGASLLPSGLTSVEGAFGAGDLVELRDEEGPFARGLACYGAEDLRRIAGQKAGRIAAILGFHYADEAVHRDDLALLTGGELLDARGGRGKA